MSVLINDKSGATTQQILLAGNTNTDQVLNGSSKNAIANKAVYNALKDKIDKAVQDLVYYYTKNDVYNKAETRALLSTISTMDIKVVNSLPVSDISTTTIYFLKPTGSQNYDEYVYVDNAWVKIGDTGIDLSQYLKIDDFQTAIADYYTKAEIDAKIAGYYTKAEVDALLDAKQDPLTFDNTPTAGSNNPVTSAGIKSAIDAAASTPVDTIENGNMHAVTSNAIYDHLFGLFQPIEDAVVTNVNIDLNNCTTGGFANFLIAPANPHSCGSYGYLLVLRYGNTSNPNLCQVHFPYHSGDQFAIRCRFSGNWTSWKLYGAI